MLTIIAVLAAIFTVSIVLCLAAVKLISGSEKISSTLASIIMKSGGR